MLRLVVKILAIAMIALMSSNVFSGGFYNDDYSEYSGGSDSQQFSLTPNLQASPGDSDESFTHTAKDAYVYVGYDFTYRLLNKSRQTITDYAGNTQTYVVDGNTPEQFHGFEIGIGKALTKYVDLQLAYVQEFRQTKNSTIGGSASQNSVSMQGVDVNALWIFNPDDRFQVGARLGVRVADFREKVVLGTTDYYPVDDTTEINPRAGLDFNCQITQSVSFRVDATYTASAYRVFYDGGIEASAGLSYKL